MISRKLIWFAALAFLALLAVTKWAGSYPARVVVMNQGAAAHGVKLATAGQLYEIGTLRAGETRVLKVESGDYVTVELSAVRRWQSPEKLAPAQSLVIGIANDRVQIQRAAASRRTPD